MSTGTDHADIWAFELASCEPTEWERWIDAVESILGHSADGDGEADGYSLDEFYDTWKQGLSPDAVAAGIRHIVTRDGHQYWLRKLPGGEFFVNRANPPSPEWSGEPWWTQIGGPFATRHLACEWLTETGGIVTEAGSADGVGR
ncbi:hypothetical protein [Mycolicibacterium hodleri]|uniref:hypothetical protein n=1 Tax=Mycolicibacterium hodleri TaxID=49897 RepID=UPI0021F34A8F|nr:hypothetical protein [Mycolicibacterium hodleri]